MPQVPDIQVQAGTPNTGTENSLVFIRSVDPKLHFYQVDKHPLTSLILSYGMSLVNRENSNLPKITGRSLAKKAKNNFKIEWFEDALYKEVYNPTAALTASATSITVSSTDDDYFRANDVLLLTNAAGQTERTVIASVTANTLNIVNPDGTTRTAGITMTTADEFILMENARAEDSTAPAIRTTKSANMYNYLEIISEPYGLTRTKQATGHYTGNQWELERMKAYSKLLSQVEKMMLFGTRAVSGGTTNPVYHSGGLKYFMELYSDVEIRDMAGQTLTKAEFDSFVAAVSKSGSTTKVALCSGRALEAINSFGYEVVREQGFRFGELGMNLKKVFGPFGELTLAYEPEFDKIAAFQGDIMIVDMANLDFCFLQGGGINLDLHSEDIVLADGSLAKKGQWVGQVGLQPSTLKNFGWMRRIGR